MGISSINNQYNVATKAQYNTYPNTNTTDYSTNYPAYVEEEEPKSKMNLGMVALGVLGVAGIAYGAVKHKKLKEVEKGLKDAKTTLDDITKKLTEAEEKLTSKENALDAANKTIEELKKPLKKKFSWETLKFWKKFSKKKA